MMLGENRRERRKNWYFWLVAKDPETGKPYLIAGGKTEDEARQKGLEMLGGIGADFTIRRLPTISMAAASSMIKGRRLEKTKSLHKATERLGHNRSLRRRTLRQQGGF